MKGARLKSTGMKGALARGSARTNAQSALEVLGRTDMLGNRLELY